MKRNEFKLEFKCEKCGAPQPKNEKESTENWNVYDCNQTCKCGGRFARFFNGEKISE